jgi:hypothetical protein
MLLLRRIRDPTLHPETKKHSIPHDQDLLVDTPAPTSYDNQGSIDLSSIRCNAQATINMPTTLLFSTPNSAITKPIHQSSVSSHKHVRHEEGLARDTHYSTDCPDPLP